MSEWTEQRIETAVRMWRDEAKPASEVAEAVGMSRNAVIGKMHRLGYSKNPRTRPKLIPTNPTATAAPERRVLTAQEAPVAPKPKPKKVTPVIAPEPGAAAAEPSPGEVPTLAEQVVKPDIEPKVERRVLDPFVGSLAPRPSQNLVDVVDEGVPLLQGLPSSGVCKFPLWSDNSSLPIEEKRVCGRPSPGGVWCNKHHKLVFEQHVRRR